MRSSSRRRLPPILLTLLALPCLLLAQEEIPFKGPPEPQTIAPLMASEMPEQLDTYAHTTSDLARLSGRFQDNYQRFIRTLDQRRRTNKPLHGEKGCLPDELAIAYTGARDAWGLYHRQARVVRNQYRRLEAFQSAGYAPGLTPDLQDRLRRAIDAYERIRQEHINLQSLLQQQLDGELKRLGCDPEDIVAPAKPVLEAPVAQVPHRSGAAKPGAHNGRKEAPAAARDDEALADAESGAGGEPVDAEAITPEEIVAPESLVPVEESPAPMSTRSPLEADPASLQDTPRPAAGDAEGGASADAVAGSVPGGGDRSGAGAKDGKSPQEGAKDGRDAKGSAAGKDASGHGDAGNAGNAGDSQDGADGKDAVAGKGANAGRDDKSGKDVNAGKDADGGGQGRDSGAGDETEPTPDGPAALKVRFSVDNRLCSQKAIIYLDGHRLGAVDGQQTASFSASEGRHTLCLAREGEKTPCREPSDLIRVIIYQGFAIRPRC